MRKRQPREMEKEVVARIVQMLDDNCSQALG
jgi:hypothetical protein